MAGNAVTLTFAGDATSLERAMNQVGQASEQMANEVSQDVRQMASSVGSSEEAFEGMARGANRTGEVLDRVSGSASMLSGGLGDVGGALTEAFGEEHPIGKFGEEMEKAGTIVMFFTGAADLALLANTALSASFVKNAAAQVAAKAATIATATATGVATAAQWLWNAAFAASGIGLIVIGVAALVAGIIYLATQTTFFQDLWRKVWAGIVSYINFVKDNYIKVFRAMAAIGGWLMDQIKAIPGRIGAAFSGLFNIITAPWRAAFNFIARAWNNTIGRLSWSIPSWVPGVGGNSISAPKLPQFHQGGIVPGAPGSEMVALLQAGERVIPAGGSSGAATTVVLQGGDAFWGSVIDEISRRVGERGGDVQLVLGGRRG